MDIPKIDVKLSGTINKTELLIYVMQAHLVINGIVNF